ncbi:MAG: hypothetical protein QXD75_00120 [Desulfurococcaceae archaeon]
MLKQGGSRVDRGRARAHRVHKPGGPLIPRLVNFEMRLVEGGPDVVIFHACEIPWKLVRVQMNDRCWSFLVNQLT